MYMMNGLFMIIVDFFLMIMFSVFAILVLAILAWIFKDAIKAAFYFIWSKVHKNSFEYHQRRVGLKQESKEYQ